MRFNGIILVENVAYQCEFVNGGILTFTWRGYHWRASGSSVECPCVRQVDRGDEYTLSPDSVKWCAKLSDVMVSA